MRIEVPYKVGTGRPRPDRPDLIARIPVELSQVEEAHAPVAVRMAGAGMTTVDYRLHEGSLWCETLRDRDFARFDDDERIWLNHPLTFGLPQDAVSRRNVRTVPLPNDDHHRKILAVIEHNARNCTMIGERIYRRSTGPLLLIRGAGYSIEWNLGIDASERRPQDARLFALPIHLQDVAAETVAAAGLPVPPNNSRHVPEVLIEYTQDFDPLANAQEALAWQAIWAVRRKTIDEIGERAVESLFRLRSALEDRWWPGHGVDYQGTNSEADMWPHRPGRFEFPADPRLGELALDLLRGTHGTINEYFTKQGRLFEGLRDVLARRSAPEIGAGPQDDELAALRF